MKIDNYEFGRITIDGKNFTKDVIIMPNEIKTNWWRKQSHRLILADIQEIIDDKPDILLVGTGKFGLMKVSDKVIEYCKNNQIELIIDDTSTIVRRFNELSNSEKRIIAALHLTC